MSLSVPVSQRILSIGVAKATVNIVPSEGLDVTCKEENVQPTVMSGDWVPVRVF